ncbi:hypothetical protein WJX72_011988 [[Myrmecia] bisecta]|uniref:Dol-P-Glc:Glc(2)Man(9)GlcNAc(2)-PP-Dol alpha-1,2-glucosyltransferase n=1 Tax=[Myrmecia] bisecta TaxID=41462 RepID=A0AAW1QT13_9CHLO
MSMNSHKPLIIAGCLLVPLIATVAFQISTYVPDPYMDEVFHVPQTAKYCRGQFMEWDPKITTFPGLYIFGTVYAWTLHRLESFYLGSASLEAACGTSALRSLNLLFAAACFLLAYLTHRELHPVSSDVTSAFTAAALALFPLHFFYTFLYYTDTGAAACVLAAYLACLRRRHHWSALAAAAATGFRQTNAVWAAFILAVGVMRECRWQTASGWACQTLRQQLRQLLSQAWQMKGQLVARLWSLALVPLAFAVFVNLNGGIVVGDRSAHVPVWHLAQPLYFVLYTASCLAPFHFHPARLWSFFKDSSRVAQAGTLRARVCLLLLVVLLAWAVQKGTLAHPYLLADNRHYTFYIWKNFFARHPAARFMLLPLYLYAGWSLWESLHSQQPALWMLALGLCTTATTVPAWLLEFRYFTVPAFLVLLHMRPMRVSQLAQTLALYMAVNAATLYMFLYRPFRWPDGSQARFLW